MDSYQEERLASTHRQLKYLLQIQKEHSRILSEIQKSNHRNLNRDQIEQLEATGSDLMKQIQAIFEHLNEIQNQLERDKANVMSYQNQEDNEQESYVEETTPFFDQMVSNQEKQVQYSQQTYSDSKINTKPVPTLTPCLAEIQKQKIEICNQKDNKNSFKASLRNDSQLMYLNKQYVQQTHSKVNNKSPTQNYHVQRLNNQNLKGIRGNSDQRDNFKENAFIIQKKDQNNYRLEDQLTQISQSEIIVELSSSPLIIQEHTQQSRNFSRIIPQKLLQEHAEKQKIEDPKMSKVYSTINQEITKIKNESLMQVNAMRDHYIKELNAIRAEFCEKEKQLNSKKFQDSKAGQSTQANGLEADALNKIHEQIFRSQTIQNSEEPSTAVIDELKNVKAERDFYHNKLLVVRQKLQQSAHLNPGMIYQPQIVQSSLHNSKADLNKKGQCFVKSAFNESEALKKQNESLNLKEYQSKFNSMSAQEVKPSYKAGKNSIQPFNQDQNAADEQRNRLHDQGGSRHNENLKDCTKEKRFKKDSQLQDHYSEYLQSQIQSGIKYGDSIYAASNMIQSLHQQQEPEIDELVPDNLKTDGHDDSRSFLNKINSNQSKKDTNNKTQYKSVKMHSQEQKQKLINHFEKPLSSISASSNKRIEKQPLSSRQKAVASLMSSGLPSVIINQTMYSPREKFSSQHQQKNRQRQSSQEQCSTFRSSVTQYANQKGNLHSKNKSTDKSPKLISPKTGPKVAKNKDCIFCSKKQTPRLCEHQNLGNLITNNKTDQNKGIYLSKQPDTNLQKQIQVQPASKNFSSLKNSCSTNKNPFMKVHTRQNSLIETQNFMKMKSKIQNMTFDLKQSFTSHSFGTDVVQKKQNGKCNPNLLYLNQKNASFNLENSLSNSLLPLTLKEQEIEERIQRIESFIHKQV